MSLVIFLYINAKDFFPVNKEGKGFLSKKALVINSSESLEIKLLKTSKSNGKRLYIASLAQGLSSFEPESK